MSSLGSPNSFFLAGKKAYEVERSIRNDQGTADVNSGSNFEHTYSSASNQKTFTISVWVKICNVAGNIGDDQYSVFSTGGGGSGAQQGNFFFMNDATLQFVSQPQPSPNTKFITTRKFRDFSAWYHIVVAVDTTQATQSNRVKIYINGVQETDFSTATYPSQNADLQYNQAVRHRVGSNSLGSNLNSTYGNFNGYIAEFNFLDGYAYDPSYFGETDAITGQWNPKKYVGSYGTNGFYLNFSDNSGTTATTLGKDSSGNGNNFTPNNFAVSDSMPDTPTNNFATMNPLNGYSGLSEGNLRFNNYNDSAGNRSVQASIALPKSGKWYWEARYQESGTGTVTTKVFGVGQIQMATGYITAPYVYYDGGPGILRNGNASDNKDGKQVWYNGTGVPAVLAIAVDVDNNSVEYFHNGSSQGTIPLPTLTSSQEYFFTWGNTSGGSSSSLNDTFNFGADSTFQGQVSSGGNTDANGKGDFKYAPPAGHLALCSANLPDPTILLPNKHFGTLLYSAGSSNGTFTFTDSDAVDFFPDWTWLKCRSAGENHFVLDSVRGNVDIDSSSSSKWLLPNRNDNEGNGGGSIDGTTVSSIQNGLKIVETSIGSGEIYFTNRSYVAWNWNAGDTDGKTYTVTVVSDSGNKYRFDGFGTSAVTLDLAEGGTYIFNYPSAHPLKFSTTADGTHGGGSEYTTGVTHNTSTQVTIVVAASAPTLYYYCSIHSGMGGAVNTNSTLGSSNFDGTIQTTVKANTTSGFSIITWTGTGSAATIGHGLGVAPKWLVVKLRSGSQDWFVNNGMILDDLGKYYKLNSSGSSNASDTNVFPNTAPTSTVFSVGTDSAVNASGSTYVAYVFSEVEGYSKFVAYTGNGSTDGTFVYTGFTPTFMIQRKSSDENWHMMDTTRDPLNANTLGIDPNLANAEANDSNLSIDFLSNGFKLRTSHSTANGSGTKYILLAFAESPFKNSRAR